jgi:hypothetical protein
MTPLSCKMHIQEKLARYQGLTLNWHF